MLTTILLNCFLYGETTGGVGPNEAISLLDYLLTDLESRIGGHDQLIIWCDNSPAHFKECYLFFYLDDLVKKGKFLRADLKFLLEGHSYSICDRRFGSIQRLFGHPRSHRIPAPVGDCAGTKSSERRSNILGYTEHDQRLQIFPQDAVHQQKRGFGR